VTIDFKRLLRFFVNTPKNNCNIFLSASSLCADSFLPGWVAQAHRLPFCWSAYLCVCTCAEWSKKLIFPRHFPALFAENICTIMHYFERHSISRLTLNSGRLLHCTCTLSCETFLFFCDKPNEVAHSPENL